MPASVLALFKAEMVKEGVKPENAKLGLIKLGFLTAQETSKGEGRSSDFDDFKRDLSGRIKSEGLGQVVSIKTTKGGDIQVVIDRSIESLVNKDMGIKGRCNYISGYIMGLVNSCVPTGKQYICKELACVNEGNTMNCIFELKAR